MRGLVNVLVIVAAAAFVLGIVMKLGGIPPLFGKVAPLTIWRFTVALLAFAMTLALIEIRDSGK